MNSKRLTRNLVLLLAAVLLGSVPASAQVSVYCPGDGNGDATWDNYCAGDPTLTCNVDQDCNPAGQADYRPCVEETQPANTQCIHLTGSDGFAVMADGVPMYMFSFGDATGTWQANVMNEYLLKAEWPAPNIELWEGNDFYLSLSNVGMVIRPDLFDAHTVHFHGFPESSSVFDGLPESGLSINQGSTLTYFYHLEHPGTYMYHCHVEATEHMQMGMLGNLYIHPAQNGDMVLYPSGLYAYNDGDGSTGYDVDFPIQLGSWDPEFHQASWDVQPLPFALMWDRYPMINGRGYPDTIDPNPLATPPGPADNGGFQSQPESALITATAGQKVLLRLSNLNITEVHTLMSPSIPMRVVAIDAKELMAANGTKLHYTTNSVTMGGGQSADVILDTAGVPAGDYYLYASNLQYLANWDENQPTGGMMTKIVVSP